MKKRVSRIGRVFDLVGLLLLLGGAAVCARAWFGFRSVPDYQREPGGELWATVQLADGFWRLQRIGVGLMLAGLGVFIAAWWFAGRGAGRPGGSRSPGG